MSFNLTSQQIKDTYEQLAQVSASLLVNGTGSLSPIVTSSIINFPTEVSRSAAAAGFGAGGVSEATFTAYTSSNDSKVNSLTSATSSYALKTAISGAFVLPSGVVSSSAQVIQNIDGQTITPSMVSQSSGFMRSVGTDLEIRFTNISGSTVFTNSSGNANVRVSQNSVVANVPFTASIISATTGFVGNLTGTSSFATNANTLDGLDSTAFAQLASNNTFSGTQTFLNIGVTGTASFGYVQQVTGSAVVIGEEFIILNTALPAARYAGLKVYDTGSTESTASFLFDGLYNDWFYQYSGSDGTDFGVALFGPEYSAIGTPSYPTANQIQKGTGGHHLTGSNISDNGSQVSITGPVSASTYFGNGSNLTGISSGLILGYGLDSLQSALTTTPALANANGSISIGNSSFTNSTASIAIGVNSQIGTNANGAINIGSGSISENCNASIAIGQGSNVAGNRSNVVAIGVNASAGGEGVAIGSGASGVLASGNDGQTVAIGKNAAATSRYSIAIGEGSVASTEVQNTAVGRAASATGGNATALGQSSNASGVNATAISNANATAVNAVAIGEGANASNTNTTAVGVAANATGDESIALGVSSNASGENSTIVGRRGTASGARSISIGSLTEATAADAIAIGTSVTATSSNAINIGNVFKYDGTSGISLIGSLTSLTAALGAGQDVSITNTTTTTTGSRIIIGARTADTASVGVNSILIGGGTSVQKAAGDNNVLIGGNQNQVTESIAGSTNASFVTMLNGQNNRIQNSGSSATSVAYSSIIGGTNNIIQKTGTPNVSHGAIIGGTSNRLSTAYSAIVGGQGNIVSASLSTSAAAGWHGMLGGRTNKIDALDSSAIIGGRFNSVSGSYAVVIGGATGSALHDRSVVIGGSSLSTTEANQVVVPNLLVSGQINSPVFSASIASSTSSIDFNEGNFAVLTLTTPTHIGNPSNIKSGTTYTLIINSGSLASTYGTSFKFAGGTKPTLSNGVDIVTMVSDGSSLFGTGLANFS